MNTNQLLHQQQALHPSGGNVGPIPYISLSCLYLFPEEGPNPGPATQKRVIFPLAAATHCSMLSQCLQGSLSLPGFEETLIGQVRLPGRRNEHHHRSISSESARHTCSPPLPGVVGSCPPGADRSLKSAGSPPGREYGSAQGLSEEEDADGPKNSGVAMPSDCPANDEAGEVSVMIGGPVPKGEGGGIRNHWGALVRTCAQEKYMALVELQNRHGFYKRMHYDTLMDSDFASIRDSPPPDESVGTIDDLPESVTDAVRSAAEEMDCEEAMEALNGQTHIMTARYLPVSIPAAPPQLHSDSSVTTSTLKVMADACLERTFTCWASNGGQRMPTYPFPNISMNTLAILAEYLVKIFVLDVNSVVDLQICESAVGSPSDVSAGLTAEGDPDPNGVNAFLTGIEVVLAASLLGV